MEAVTNSVLVFALIVAAMAAVGVGIVLTRETLQVRWRAWLVERLVAPLARQPALLSSQRHGQGAAQPRVSHLRRHALGDGTAGRSRHRPRARGRGRGSLHQHPVDRRRFHHLRSGQLGSDHHSGLHGVGGAGLRRHRFRADALGRRAAGRLCRPQERGGGLFPLRHDAHPRQRRKRGPDERRPLRAGHSRPLLRDGGGALDGHGLAAWAPDLDHQFLGPDDPRDPAAVRRPEISRRRSHASARSRSSPPPSFRCRSPFPGWSTTTIASPNGTPLPAA